MMISGKQLDEYKSKITDMHILWMIGELPKLKDEKYNRWIGFIQGYLWTKGIYSIEELRKHNIR